MARRIAERLRITGTLKALTPIHVGGAGSSPETDLPLALNGRGAVHVPGTSLAGALRSHCARLVGGQRADVIAELWGDWPRWRSELPSDGAELRTQEEKQHASFILVEDAAVGLAGIATEIRDGVGIDRVWGAAAERVKFDRAVLPRGATLSLAMTVELQSENQTPAAWQREAVTPSHVKELIRRLLLALEAGEVRLGAARTRGLGRVQLLGLRIDRDRMDRREGILNLLRDRPDATLALADLASEVLPVCKLPRLAIAIAWRPTGALMVKADYGSVAVDALPLMSAADGKMTPVLPGSSVKGALRSHAERIVRTIRGERAPRGDGAFLNQVKVDLVTDLFGTSRVTEEDVLPEADEPRPGLGALSIEDCYPRTLRIPPDAWERCVAAADERELGEMLDRAGLSGAAHAFHVAVDRWTGGAAEHLLYSVLEPHGIAWEPLRLELDLLRLPEDKKLPALTLLLLVLQDLARGRIPLGHGTHRGMGAVAVEEVALTGKDLTGDLAALDGQALALAGGRLEAIDGELRQRLEAAWTHFVQDRSAA